MKALFLLSAVMLASPALAEKACWDATFGYNYARAVVTEKGLEISFQGNTLGLPPLATDSGHSLTFGGFSGRNPQFHVVIPKAAVTEKGDTLTAQMSGSVADAFDGRIPALWIAHNVLDLDSAIEALTPIPLVGLKAKVTDQVIQLSFTQLWAYSGNGDYRAATLKVPCAFTSAPDDLRVPPRLADFLSKASTDL